ncbi:hypothetical protein [Xylanimonas allomyrinae]|nr:hypothetical protein [Xylanimonas allomyrinae]
MIVGTHSALASPASVDPQGVQERTDSLVDALRNSDDPYLALDQMGSEDQELILDEIREMSADDIQTLFKEALRRVPRSSGYDTAISILEKASCVVLVDLLSCNNASKAADTASRSAKTLFSRTWPAQRQG